MPLGSLGGSPISPLKLAPLPQYPGGFLLGSFHLCRRSPAAATMPRRSSGRSTARAAPVRNPPQPVSRAPPPAPIQSGGGSMLGGIGSTIAEGMAFGTGSAVAHRAVDTVMGPRTVQHVVSEAPAATAAPQTTNAGGADACSIHSKAFQDCINRNGSDIVKCQFYLDMLNECRRRSGSMVNA